VVVRAGAVVIERVRHRFDVGRLAGRAGERAAVQLRRLDEVVALSAAPAVLNPVRARRDALDVVLGAVVGPVARLLRRREVVSCIQNHMRRLYEAGIIEYYNKDRGLYDIIYLGLDYLSGDLNADDISDIT